MQDQYAGDIGDYIKLALLRVMAPGHRLGIAWYRVPDGGGPDGRHIRYLDSPEKWQHFDPQLYERLAALVKSNSRTISALEGALAIEGTRFSNQLFAHQSKRLEWFSGVREDLKDCDLLFLDPDNGIEPAGFRSTRKLSMKSVTYAEISALGYPMRPMILYSHQTRAKGGHSKEVDRIIAEFKRRGGYGCFALRARSFSPRIFLFIDPTPEIRRRAKAFADLWYEHVSFIGDLPDPDALPDDSPFSERAERDHIELQRRIDGGEFEEFLAC